MSDRTMKAALDEAEAVARAICRRANLDDGFADNEVLRASIEQGMWRNHIAQAVDAIAALDAHRAKSSPQAREAGR